MEERQELIEKYVMKTCTEAEKAEVESMMASSPEFAVKVREYRLAMASVTAFAAKQRKEELLQLSQSLHKAHQGNGTGNEKKTLLLRRSVYAMAAAIALLLMVWIFLPGTQPTNQELFAEHFQPEQPHASSTRGESASLDSLSNLAIQQFEQQQWFDAALSYDLIQQSAEEAQVKNYARLYQGISLMHLGETAESISIFHSINNHFEDQASWYLILSHLKQGNGPAAIQQACKHVANGYRFMNIGKESAVKKVLEDLGGECE